METFLNFLGHASPYLRGVGLPVAVVIILILINRFLQRSAQDVSGLKFRNQLIMLGASFIGLLAVILLLPVESSTRGQLLSLIGIIISATIALSSSTILGNAMAGIMLKSVRNFRSGDFVRAGEHFGRVSERGLFHTEIQTPDRDLTTLPNLFLAMNPVTVVRQSGTIVGASVSLGYDIPRSKIEQLLMAAAQGIGLEDSFVQVIDLGDFSITYRVAGLLTDTKQLIAYRSRLRAAMLDSLHGGGVEIVSPTFMNRRELDPRKAVVPPAYDTVAGPTADSPPADVVFDKAENAETRSLQEYEFTELGKKLEEVRQAIKDSADEVVKAKLEGDLLKLEAESALLAEAIRQAGEDQKVDE